MRFELQTGIYDIVYLNWNFAIVHHLKNYEEKI